MIMHGWGSDWARMLIASRYGRGMSESLGAPSMIDISDSKFPLGHLVATSNAAAQLSNEALSDGLRRHASGDWGELDDEDRAENEDALAVGNRLLSVYTSSTGVTFWIITEWDRSVTTILLPEDY